MAKKSAKRTPMATNLWLWIMTMMSGMFYGYFSAAILIAFL